ncbi:MAG: hypothetical protein U5N85_20820 [Arcicella sp.]|nr:hypothetical protein [Arcicella sp.]
MAGNKELQIPNKNQGIENTKKIVRQAGWGKGIFSMMTDDFDDTPIGFENYVPNP